MKTREIRGEIKSRGYEAGTVYILETMNEEIQQLHSNMKDMGVHFIKLVQALDGVLAVADNMKDLHDKLMPKEQAHPELGANTNALDKE